MKIFIRSLAFLVVTAAWFVFWGSGPNGNVKQVDLYNNGQGLTKDTVTVMTYNIGYLSGMINNTAAERTYEFFDDNLILANDFISQYKPDIIGFQEIDFNSSRSFGINQLKAIGSHNQLNHLASVVNWDKAYVPFPYWPPHHQFGSIVSGQAVASSFEIMTNERIVLEQPTSTFFLYDLFYIDRLIQICLLKNGPKSFYVMNVHLEAWNQQVRQRQAKVVKEYFNRLSATKPVLLIGDFNAEPASPTYDIIMSANDIAASYQLASENLANTYPSDSANMKIDYIFYSTEQILPLEIINYSQALSSSDHLPVIFKFVM